jgi:hypothetical protein
MHRAASDGKVDIVVGDDAGELFADPGQPDGDVLTGCRRPGLLRR